jgi:hypothetical protein
MSQKTQPETSRQFQLPIVGETNMKKSRTIKFKKCIPYSALLVISTRNYEASREVS